MECPVWFLVQSKQNFTIFNEFETDDTIAVNVCPRRIMSTLFEN